LFIRGEKLPTPPTGWLPKDPFAAVVGIKMPEEGNFYLGEMAEV